MTSRTAFPDFFGALFEPFDHGDVKQRSQAGRTFSYVTARTVANRLDDAAGPENWWDDYVPGEHSVLCRLTVRLPDGSTITKCDAGGYAGMADQGDDDKSGFSDAFKRAAAKFGIGRYLYKDGVPSFADAPEPARPASSPPARMADDRPAHRPEGGGNLPRSGRALFAWVKDQEQKHEVGLLKYLNGWAKLNGLPYRLVDFTAEQVGFAVAEANRKLATVADPHPPDDLPDADASSHADDDGPETLTVAGITFERPRSGKDLFGIARRIETATGTATVRMLIDAGKLSQVPGQMADWPVEYVAVAWASLCRHAAKFDPASPDPDALPDPNRPAKVEVFRLAKRYLSIFHNRPPDQIATGDVHAVIARNYLSLWPGEVITSVNEVDEPDRLAKLREAFELHVQEARDVPDGI